jgi:hypothetical protein
MKKVVIVFVSILFGINFSNAQDDCGCFEFYARKAEADMQQWEAKYANDKHQPFFSVPNFFDKYRSEWIKCVQQCEVEAERKRQEYERIKLKMQQEQAQQVAQQKKRQAELQAQMEAQRNRDAQNAKIRARNEEIKRRNQEIAAHNARIRAEAAERRRQEAERRRQAEIERRVIGIVNPINTGVDRMRGSANNFITMQGERTDEVRKVDKSRQQAERNKANVRVTGSSMSSELRDFKYNMSQTTVDIPVSSMSIAFTEHRSPSKQTKEEKEGIKEEAEKYTGLYYIIRDNEGNEYFVLDEEDVYATIESIEYDEEYTSGMVPKKSTITVDGFDASRGVTEAYDALSSMERISSSRLVANGKKCTFETIVVPIYDPLSKNSNTNLPISPTQSIQNLPNSTPKSPNKLVEKPKKTEETKENSNVSNGYD